MRNQGDSGEYENPYMDEITGAWKLTIFTGLDTLDLQRKNIIYDFGNDGVLTIFGSLPDDLAEGEYMYDYKKPNVPSGTKCV